MTVPILVYLLGVEATVTAPAYSLFVVGVVCVIGATIKHKQGYVDLKIEIEEDDENTTEEG